VANVSTIILHAKEDGVHRSPLNPLSTAGSTLHPSPADLLIRPQSLGATLRLQLSQLQRVIARVTIDNIIAFDPLWRHCICHFPDFALRRHATRLRGKNVEYKQGQSKRETTAETFAPARIIRSKRLSCSPACALPLWIR
jgi:hypothetical protein